MFLKTFSFFAKSQIANLFNTLDSDDQRRSKDPVKDLRCFFCVKTVNF